MTKIAAILNRRREIFQHPLPDNEFVPAYTEMVSNAQEIVNELTLITPPESLQDIHADATVFFDLNLRWLGLELEYRKTSDFPHQEQANALLPEVNARSVLLSRDLARR